MSSCCPPKEPTKPSCCGANSTSQKKRPDVLLWGSLIAVTVLYALAVVFPETLIPYPRLMEAAHGVHHLVHQMWWGVVMGIIFVGLIGMVPQKYVLNLLGNGGSISGIMRATSAGVLLDMCSHGILMVGAKLYQKGASLGQVMAFLLASPWNSLSLTIILWSLIGGFWTLMFIGLSMVVGIITGLIFDRLVKKGVLPPNPFTPEKHEPIHLMEDMAHLHRYIHADKKFLKTFVSEAKSGSRVIIKWLLFGIVLASTLRAAFPIETFAGLFGPTALGLGLTVLFATVLEVCSEGSTPVAADILTRAQSPGNAFAFLMAGVSTDYTEIMILKDTTKSWKIALFLPLVSLPQIIAIAALITVFAQ
ncbi:MAG: permease [Alphaproteobacteria bacterium]|nr:permease [Alphaproteobacteria bacterium]